MSTENLNNVIDIDLSVTNRKPIRINKDDSRIVYINTSDVSILSRMTEVYPKLKALNVKAAETTSGINLKAKTEEESIESARIIADRLKEIDSEMRELIDYIFDAPVSVAVAPDGSMYDPFEGTFRYDHIISVFMDLYEDNLNKEYKKMKAQVEKHTAKYKR